MGGAVVRAHAAAMLWRRRWGGSLAGGAAGGAVGGVVGGVTDGAAGQKCRSPLYALDQPAGSITAADAAAAAAAATRGVPFSEWFACVSWT